jgi:transposase
MKIYFQHKNQTIKLVFKKNKLRKKIIVTYFTVQLKNTLQKIYAKKEQLGMILVFIQPYLSFLNSLEFIWKNINESRFHKTSWISYGTYRVDLSEYTELAKSKFICKDLDENIRWKNKKCD